MVTVGVTGAFFFNALSFLISLMFVMRIRVPLPAEQVVGRYITDLADGFRYLRSEPRLLALLAVFAGLNFFAAPLLLIMPLIVKDVLHAQVDWLAWLQLAFGFGSALVVLVFSFRKGFRQVYLIMCSACFIMGICLLGLAFSVNKAPVLLALFVSGMAVAVVNALALSVFQETVPYELKGRFFSLLNTVCFAVLPLTFLLNGALAEAVRLPVLIVCNGLGTILLSVIILFLPRLRDNVGQSVSTLTINSV